MMASNKFMFSVLLIASYNFITTMASADTALSIDAFSSKLHQILARQEGNIVSSPFGVHNVLSLLYQGATGSTAESLKRALYLASPEANAAGYKSLLIKLYLERWISLQIASKLFMQIQYTLKKEFISVAEKNFLSEAENVDFVKNHETAKLINDWIREKTNNTIEFNANPTSFSSITRLVLVNAVYFLGNWQHQFNPNLTRHSQFYLSEQNSINVSTMNIRAVFEYKDDLSLDAEILRLPYNKQDFGLIIVLPKSKTGLKKLEEKLASRTLSYICRGLQDELLEVFLPKFKLEKTLDLTDSLTALGLGGIFGKSSNFSNIVDSLEDIHVSEVEQKIAIEVNELGTEASYTPGVPVETKNSAKRFMADHPFLYAVTYNQNGIILPLVVGRVSQP